jgi:V/A-type H+-transporting ATPase subunit E
MGYPELLRVIEEEAAREVRALLDAAEAERARLLAEARAGAAAAGEALLARARAEAEAGGRAAREALELERRRGVLLEQRRLLDALRAEVAARLTAARGPALDARLLAEVLAEAGPGPIELAVDPGAEDAVREAAHRLAPERAGALSVRAAPAPRGGVEAIAGRRVLDDTLPARLERAWPALEQELASLLFAEDGCASTP